MSWCLAPRVFLSENPAFLSTIPIPSSPGFRSPRTERFMPAPLLQDLRTRLAAIGQQHLINFHDQLPPAQQQSLLAQLVELDLAALPALVNDYVKNKPAFHLPNDVAPAPYYPHDHTSKTHPWDRAKIANAGEDLIRRAKVA